MINELFLSCALAAVPMFSGHTDSTVPAHVLGEIVHTPRFIYHYQKSKKKILVISGQSTVVAMMRIIGLAAFGAYTEDGFGLTQWHFATDINAIATPSGLFGSVYVLHPNPFKDEMIGALHESIRMVELNGFLMFDDETYPVWSGVLSFYQWERLPFREGRLMIWQKPNRNPISRERPWLKIIRSQA